MVHLLSRSVCLTMILMTLAQGNMHGLSPTWFNMDLWMLFQTIRSLAFIFYSPMNSLYAFSLIARYISPHCSWGLSFSIFHSVLVNWCCWSSFNVSSITTLLEVPSASLVFLLFLHDAMSICDKVITIMRDTYMIM